jgi:hypothetical protein
MPKIELFFRQTSHVISHYPNREDLEGLFKTAMVDWQGQVTDILLAHH